jgi:hypothetical protein
VSIAGLSNVLGVLADDANSHGATVDRLIAIIGGTQT